jgi:ankyrin repeat protein
MFPEHFQLICNKTQTLGKLYKAIYTRNLNELKELTLSLDIHEYYKENLLHKAAETGYIPTVEYLLIKGFYINQKDYKSCVGYTPLHYAASKGHGHMMLYLLDKGANLSIAGEGNVTALDVAAQEGYHELVRNIFEYMSTMGKQMDEPHPYSLDDYSKDDYSDSDPSTEELELTGKDSS